jgi:hypothetical protein
VAAASLGDDPHHRGRHAGTRINLTDEGRDLAARCVVMQDRTATPTVQAPH